MIQRALALALSTLLWHSAASAAPLLDQSQLVDSGHSGVTTTWERAQTFTAGLSGLLSQVDISVTPMASEDLLFSVYGTTGGVPNESSLLDVLVPSGAITTGPFTPIDLSANLVFVEAGDVLAFGLRSATGSDIADGFRIDLTANTADPYPGGTLFKRNKTGAGGPAFETWKKDPDNPFSATKWDLVFRTHVDPDVVAAVPEPSTALLLGSGLIGLPIRRRQRKA